MNSYLWLSLVPAVSLCGDPPFVCAPEVALVAATGLASPRPDLDSLQAGDLAIWSSADFRRRFAESYLAETDIEPRLSEDEAEVLNEVRDRIGAEKLAEAITLLKKAISPGSSAALDCMLGNLYFQLEQPEEAAPRYLAAVDKHPKFRRAWRNLGMLYVRENDYVRALPALTRVIEQGGGDALTYGLLGFSYAQGEDHVAAESAYRMAILLDAATLDWKLGLVRSLFEQARFAEAAAVGDVLLSRNPERADLWLVQANAYIGLGQPLAAAGNFEMVQRLGKSTAESLTLLGDIYVNEGLFDKALDAYERALQVDANVNLERLLQAARVMSARAAHGEAHALAQALEAARGERLLPDERKHLLKLRARIAVARGEGDEEARVLQEIIDLDPLDGEALLLLAQYSARNADNERAIMLYERAAGLTEFEARARVGHAQVLVRGGDYVAALPLLRRAQELDERESVQRYLEQVEALAQRR